MSTESVRDVEIWARNLLDVNFKYTWTIENYIKLLDNRINIDSPTFEVSLVTYCIVLFIHSKIPIQGHYVLEDMCT